MRFTRTGKCGFPYVWKTHVDRSGDVVWQALANTLFQACASMPFAGVLIAMLTARPARARPDTRLETGL
jgi:ABC-type Fe3+ transport system permease subunit